MTEALFESNLRSLPLAHRGKVRDIYAINEDHLLIVTTDRLSAFDVVLPTPIPGKGAVLTALSNFWFARTRHLVPNHLSDFSLDQALPDAEERTRVARQCVVVRRLKPLPLEAIVRGYLVGSGWKEYLTKSTVCDIPLPPGLREAQRLPEPIFTPSTKATVGEHDQNISFEAVSEAIGPELAEKVRATSLALYREAAEFALTRGIIIADTKFEFGVDRAGGLFLIDEALTPDSSRFWPAESYAAGASPASFDKQYVRDYLEQIGWDKHPPAPALPADVVEKTAAKYREAERRLIGEHC